MDPIILPSNQPPDRFYRGGPQISSFRGEQSQGNRTSEDWVASTTSCAGHKTLGQTRLPSGILLSEEIEKNPQEWLGPKHVEKYGPDSKLLVKLLDAGQRLPIHAHPEAGWAKTHIGANHGKAEAWYVLAPGEVYLGLKFDVDQKLLEHVVEQQQPEKILEMMHRIPVKEHNTIFVPPGVLHSIGRGVMVAEVQEPEDLSILLEWRDFEIDGAKEGHLGLGFEKALTAVETKARSEDEIQRLVTSDTSTKKNVFAKASNKYFILDRFQIDEEGKKEVEGGFAVSIVLDGQIELRPENGKALQLIRGNTVVIPYAAGRLSLKGKGQIIIARPPTHG